MKSQKFLPGTQLSGKIIENNLKEFATANGGGIGFTMIIKDTWKDKEGNKQESEPYYADCVAFGKTVAKVKDIIQMKQMAVAKVLPTIEKWTDAGGNEKSKTKFKVSFIEGWYFESAEWHTSQEGNTGIDLPF